MKNRNQLIVTISFAILAIQYAIYNYQSASVIMALMSAGVSFYTLSPSKKALRHLMMTTCSIFGLELALLLLFQMGPSNPLITLIVITSAFSSGCWSMIYQRENKAKRFTLLIVIEALIAILSCFATIASSLPQSVVNGFKSVVFLSGRQGILQVIVCLIIPIIAAIQWMSLLTLINGMTYQAKEKEYRTTKISMLK